MNTVKGEMRMCTCITYDNGDFYFGRNLDLDCSFGEKVMVTPRNFVLNFKKAESIRKHYAMIGMASENKRFPLYAEAANEKGLCMAGLYFPGNAYYEEPVEKGLELASFEIIPWILGVCASVKEAVKYFKEMRIIDLAFSEQMPPAPLHWMLSDRKQCLVIETDRAGLHIYENPVGVLTNNPPFIYHKMNLNNYLALNAHNPRNFFSDKLVLCPYSQGMGAMGLPGDVSSASRFIRAAFLKWNSAALKEERSNVAQFFHILEGVSMVRGSVINDAGNYEITRYSCCINAHTGTYYYKTYDDIGIRRADLNPEKLNGSVLEICQ